MKRVSALLFVILILCTSLFACDSTNGQNPKTLDIANTVLEKVKESEMTQLSEKTVFKFYNINSDDIESACVYVSSSGAVADEIAVFKAKEKSKVSVIKDGINERIDNRIDNFKDYVPAEIDKINNNVVLAKGNYLIFVISSKSADVQDEFDSFFIKK